MDIQELIYGPISESISDELLEKMLEVLRQYRDLQLSRQRLRRLFDVRQVNDEETGLPAYGPRLFSDDLRADYIAEADWYLKTHYPQLVQTDGDVLKVKEYSERLRERLRADGLVYMERLDHGRIERVPVRGDTGALENLVSYRDWSGTRHEVGEKEVDRSLAGLFRQRKQEIDLRITEIIQLMTARQLRREHRLPSEVPELPQKETLERISWASEKLDEMVSWAIELHRLGLVEEEPNEILFHCRCNSNVYDTEKLVLHSAYENRVTGNRQLHWKGQLGELLLMVKFLNERKCPSPEDPTEEVVDILDGDFYVHFFFVSQDARYASRSLRFDESRALKAVKKTMHDRTPIFNYWKNGSRLFKFLEERVCSNESYRDH